MELAPRSQVLTNIGGLGSIGTTAEACAHLLIDFDNFFPTKAGDNSFDISHLIRVALSTLPPVDRLEVRLYGGWTTTGTLSPRGSDVARQIPGLDPFPIYRGRLVLRGSVTLATGPQKEPGLVFDDMYRRRTRSPRLRLSREPLPDGCVGDVTNCPARILKKFTRTPAAMCPGAECAVTADAAFLVVEQKMVDTLMACDILELSLDPSIVAIVVASGDCDLVPPLVCAGRQPRIAVTLIQPSGVSIGRMHEEVLLGRGVRVTSVSGGDSNGA